nr:DUF2345 domain-containing protein [Paraburkholderia phenoliruptrix]
MQHSAGQNVIVTADQDMDVSVVQRLRMAVGGMISLCAHRLGINLTAAKGKFTASALTDGMELFAKQQVRMASESADVQVSAKSKIALNSGGASLEIEGGNMTFHCPGSFTIKATSFTFVGRTWRALVGVCSMRLGQPTDFIDYAVSNHIVRSDASQVLEKARPVSIQGPALAGR